MANESYEGWALLELMGHRQRVGFVREVEIYGGKMLRIDIPAGGGDITEFYGCSSIHSLRPITEEIARDKAKFAGDPRPVRPVEYRALPAPIAHEHDDINEYDDGLSQGGSLASNKFVGKAVVL